MLTDTKKILVVEDDPNIREMIILILEAAEYTVTDLDDGHQVIPFVRDAPPDLVLLDVRLGDVDGRDICKA